MMTLDCECCLSPTIHSHDADEQHLCRPVARAPTDAHCLGMRPCKVA